MAHDLIAAYLVTCAYQFLLALLCVSNAGVAKKSPLGRTRCHVDLKASTIATSDKVHIVGLGDIKTLHRNLIGRGALAPALSARIFHHSPIHILGDKDLSRAKGLAICKARLILRFVETLPPNDFVLYMDSSDAWLQQPSGLLVERYLALIRRRFPSVASGHEPVLVNGVRFCYPFEGWGEYRGKIENLGLADAGLAYGMDGYLLWPRELCKRYRSQFQSIDGERPFPEDGAWFGRVSSVRTFYVSLQNMIIEQQAMVSEAGGPYSQREFWGAGLSAMMVARLRAPWLFVVDGHWEIFAAPEVELASSIANQIFDKLCGHFFKSREAACIREPVRIAQKVAPDLPDYWQTTVLKAWEEFEGDLEGLVHDRPCLDPSHPGQDWCPLPLVRSRSTPLVIHLPGPGKHAGMRRVYDRLESLAFDRGLWNLSHRLRVPAIDQDRAKLIYLVPASNERERAPRVECRPLRCSNGSSARS